MIGKIYKIINKMNGKIYIGKTYLTIKERYKQHIYNSKRENNKHRPLYRAINKYGIENFSVELIGEYEEGLLELMEIEFIKEYDSYNNGYNATLGGEGTRTFPYTDKEVIKKYKELKHVNNTAEYFNTCKEMIRRILKGNNIKIDGHKRKVAKLDKNTLKVLKTYESVNEAARQLGDVKKVSHICKVCNGQRKTAYGYRWEYIDS